MLSETKLLERKVQGAQKRMLLIFSGEGHKAKCPHKENCLCSPKSCKKQGKLTTEQLQKDRRLLISVLIMGCSSAQFRGSNIKFGCRGLRIYETTFRGVKLFCSVKRNCWLGNVWVQAELTDGQRVHIMNGKARGLWEGCAGHPH